MDKILEAAKPYALHVALALATLACGLILASIVRWLASRALSRGHSDPMVSKFVSRLLYSVVAVFAIAATLSQLGVQTNSIVAAIGAAGIAVGLALQNSLSNLASGLLIVALKPFRAGDFIEGAGQMGAVEEVGLFTTTLKTADGRKVILPNSKLTDDNIVNYAAHPTRRLDTSVSVAYASDLAFVKERVMAVLAADERIIQDPAPIVSIDQLGDSGITVGIRIWVKREDYWPVRFEVLQEIKADFDKSGIEIPFPQRVVKVLK